MSGNGLRLTHDNFAAVSRGLSLTDKTLHAAELVMCEGWAKQKAASEAGVTWATVHNAVTKVTERVFADAGAGEIAWADPLRLFPGGFASYNPSVLVSRKGLRVYSEMRKDEQIKAAMGFKKSIVTAPGWTVDVPEGQPEEWEPAEFVRWNLENLEGSFERTVKQVLTALEYGFSVSEKVWAYGPTPFGDRLYLRALKTRSPESMLLKIDQYGDLSGLEQQGTNDAGSRDLPVEKFVVFSYDREFGNWYGRSDLEAAYRAWWIKDNAYKWLSMLLERLGIPPVFMLYDKDRYTGGQVDKIKTILQRLQAGTSAVIPRASATEEYKTPGIEFWAPELANQAVSVFIPSLDKFDKDIARALLMPGQVGFTPDAQQGSYARAKINFDALLMVVDEIQGQIKEEVVQDDLIRDLVVLNYGEQEALPEFSWLPITDDKRLDLLESWTQLVEKGAVHPGAEDEAHIREILEFPAQQEEELELPIVPSPEEGEEEEGKEGEELPGE